MDAELLAEMTREARIKPVLHWNCRGLAELPEALRNAGEQLRDLYLKWNELASLPDWLAELAGLTSLYLYGNQIARLPADLGTLPKLTVLDLSANRLEEVPDCLADALPGLRTLLLNQNAIEVLPDSLSRLENLECLCLSGNRLVTLPDWLGSLSNLDEIFLDNNLLTELPNSLTLSSSINYLSICSNRLTHLPINAFLSGPLIRFDSNPRLSYLSLPILGQLLESLARSVDRGSGNTIAYGCFQSNEKTSNAKANIKLTLIPENNRDELKRIVIELPKQLIVARSLRDNTTVSLLELALRNVYLSRFRHTLDISLNSLNVNVQREELLFDPVSDMKACQKSFMPFSLIINGPVSVCMLNSCDNPIFTEAWIVFGLDKNAFLIPTIVIFCSHRCAIEFIKYSNFVDSHDMYVIRD